MSGPNTLPTRFPVFPLAGALLLPGGNLPLNIFEPRYLQMTRDAMQTDKVIGMIQPKGDAEKGKPSPLYPTGCAGRITSFEETPDGRYLITLTGVARFDVVEELVTVTPYRQVLASFARWPEDLRPSSANPGRRDALIEAMHGYFDRQRIEIDWDAVGQAPLDGLITSLAMICPFTPSEKQALLEAPDSDGRMETLITLMRMQSFSADDATGLRH
ncbi:MAG: peptidase S16 [Geminicoccaceae bacterium]|nr:MAG: peptidase S16 [Geminicoccaceae bacterium]